ncbi:MAG: redoxin domain-containing protein [Campylobacterales bacterium]|nr:redoxin domain-containing protein [Campylobacterales bacterium]
MRVFVALLTLFLLHGCGEDERQTPPKPIEKEVAPTTKEAVKNPKTATEPNATVSTPPSLPTQSTPAMDRYDKEIFSIFDFSQDSSKAKKFVLYKEGIDFKNITQKIVIINFFAQSCSPCIGQFPYLSDLQNKYQKELFLMGIILDSKMSKQELSEFANDKHAVFFLSDSEQNTRLVDTVAKQLGIKDLILPLTVIYKDGSYYMHYEGAAPIEMIESDIAQALGQLK